MQFKDAMLGVARLLDTYLELGASNGTTAVSSEQKAADVGRLTSDFEAAFSGGSEPVFWYRPREDGLYEGPHHACSVGGRLLRDERPGEWVPLFAAAARGEVDFKELVWEDGAAKALGLNYILNDPAEGWRSNGWYVLEETTNTVIEADGSEDGARAAAQKDFVARLRSSRLKRLNPCVSPSSRRHPFDGGFFA